jgi:multidrug efflux pump subunit AcrB
MIEHYIKRPISIVTLLLTLLIVGVYYLPNLRTSLLPSIDNPSIYVYINHPNSSPAFMDKNVIGPLKNSIRGNHNLVNIIAESTIDFGYLELIYEYGTDLDLASIELNNKIDQALKILPSSLNRPTIIKNHFQNIPILKVYAIPNKNVGFDHFQAVLDDFRKKINSIDGISKVVLTDNYPDELILVPKYKKPVSKEHIQEIEDQINLWTSNNFLKSRNGNYEYLISPQSSINDISDILNLEIPNQNKTSLKIGDFFTLQKHFDNKKKVFVNQKDAALLSIYSSENSNITSLTQDVHKTIRHYQRSSNEITIIASEDQGVILSKSIQQITISLIIAIILAFLTLLLSSYNFSNSIAIIIVSVASIFISLWVFNLIQLNINIISLIGFILGSGLLIDNVIILFGSISFESKITKNKKNAITEGSKAVLPAIISASLTTF